MERLSFEVQRYPCIPQPCDRKAMAAKLMILSRGGSFFRFSIDGCSNTTDLENYLLEKYGVGEGTIQNAIDIMSQVADSEMGVKVKDIWGISEIIDGNETITFTGFAYTKEELEKKTNLFLAAILKLKECLEVSIGSSEKVMLGKELWNV